MNNLISIILPCYKAEKYIRNIIGDIENQSYSNWELIIVSNGDSQENQVKIINEFCQKDNRIRLVSTVLGGVSVARNIGLQNSKGDWITFIDADDRIDSNHLQYYVDALEKENWNCDLVIGGFYIVNGGVISKQQLPEINSLRDLLLINNQLALGVPFNKMYKKSIIGNKLFPEEYTVMEDYCFNLSVYNNVTKVVGIPLSGYKYYWWNSGNATSKYHACRQNVQYECDRLVNSLYIKSGMTKEEARNIYLQTKFVNTYFLVINLFKTGCPFKMLEKRDEIKRILFGDKDIDDAYNKQPWSKQNIYIRFMTLGYILHSPLLITILYEFLFRINHLLKK